MNNEKPHNTHKGILMQHIFELTKFSLGCNFRDLGILGVVSSGVILTTACTSIFSLFLRSSGICNLKINSKNINVQRPIQVFHSLNIDITFSKVKWNYRSHHTITTQ